MNIWRAIEQLYEELFKQCTLNTSFVYNSKTSTHNDKITLVKFIKWIKNKYPKRDITITLLIQYFEFQFSRYEGKYSAGYGKNKIMLNWLIGQKAIQEWEARELKKKWLVKVKLNDEVKLKLSKAFLSVKNAKIKSNAQNTLIKVSEYEEQQKERFYNTFKGAVYCELTTTLYHPNSKWCRGCEFAEECIKIQKNNYPSLFKRRNEN